MQSFNRNKLDAVHQALVEAEVFRITVSRVTGHGRQLEEDLYRGSTVTPNLMPKVRLDIACNDEFVEVACKAILQGAKHREGEVGGRQDLHHPPGGVHSNPHRREGQGGDLIPGGAQLPSPSSRNFRPNPLPRFLQSGPSLSEGQAQIEPTPHRAGVRTGGPCGSPVDISQIWELPGAKFT